MAIKAKDIYKGSKKTHRAVKIITAVLVALAVGAVSLFFGLRHCCIYDEDGNATLILPTSRENREILRAYKETAASQEAETSPPSDSPVPDDSRQPAGGDIPEGGQTEGNDPDGAQLPEDSQEGDTPQPDGGTEPGSTSESGEPIASAAGT